MMAEPPAVVHLFGGPYVSCGSQRLCVPEGSKRLLAFVALRRARVERAYAGGALWPAGDDLRAAANLRSALWRLRRAGIHVIEADKWSLALAPDVALDIHRLAGWAGRLIDNAAEPADLDLRQVPDDACHLLPGWYEAWVVMERERLRQRVLHAIEALARLLIEQARFAEAIDAAARAVAEEPLRESAQRVLLLAHLARGDHAQARLIYARFARLLRRELEVRPSRELAAMVAAPAAGYRVPVSSVRRAAEDAPGARALPVGPNPARRAGSGDMR